MSDSESSEDEQLWEVEKIVDHRDVDEDGNKVEVEYRVRWVGFPSGDDTWEPLANLEGSMNEVNAYNERRARRERRREEKRKRKAKLFNDIPDPGKLPGMPVLNLDMDLAARPLMLPRNFDENKWELAEPFMCPFCGKINSSQNDLRIHQIKCKNMKRVLAEVKKMKEAMPRADSAEETASENEAPEMDELVQDSPVRREMREVKSDEEIEAVENIAKEMGMNVMRVENEEGNGEMSIDQSMPEMKELSQVGDNKDDDEANMSVDIFSSKESKCTIVASAPDLSALDDNGDANTSKKADATVLAQKDLNKSMSDEEYKQFLYTPPKACSTQKTASQESDDSTRQTQTSQPLSGQKRPWSG